MLTLILLVSTSRIDVGTYWASYIKYGICYLLGVSMCWVVLDMNLSSEIRDGIWHALFVYCFYCVFRREKTRGGRICLSAP